MKTRYLAVALALLPATTSFAKKPPEPMGSPSKAVTDQIVDAIAEEMNRAMTKLEIPGAPRPYQISYKITEVDVNDVSATLGQTTSRRNRHFVNLEARVRVGSNALDNSNFVVPDGSEFDGTAAANLPLDSDERIARRAAWLVTDTAYKEALIQLRAKLEARRAGASSRPADVPAWTDTKKVVSEEPVLVAPLETLDELETRVKSLSAVFRDQPALRDSRVAATSYLERRWYLTTEGTSVTDTRRASGIVIAVSGQAEDGQLLGDYFLRYGHTAKDLPSDKELTEEAKKLAQSVTALVKAPKIDKYSGPVLFEGEGAVGLVRFALAPHLGGTPIPEGMSPQEARLVGGALIDKVGLRVTSPNLSIIDDPTAKEGAGKALIGGYKTDDEGVAAQKVEVVKNGTLKTLLLSRTPSAKGQASNGHARCCSVSSPSDGGAFHGSATNLFVTAAGGQPRKALEARVAQLAKGEGLKYGLIIKRFDDAAVTGAPEFTRRELVQMIKSTDPLLPPPTLVAYRVYPNGKQELVRGAQLTDVPIRAWKDVLGTSKEVTVYNFLNATDSQLAQRLSGGTDDGFVPSGGIESSIITPDLLLKEIDVTTSTYGVRPTPSVPKLTAK
ncbi:MAG TPA: metallopeptidase TldD-related protein [Kofleriaceae bacterium]|nr:metallopeptidase TldD-related protein [Kofleriaceae bacterium]